jgi:hypothetical protein
VLAILARTLLALLIAGVVAGCSDARDLDKICRVFSALAAQPGLERMGSDERMNFVNKHVSDQLWSHSQVMSLWRNIPNYESTARYRMFKRTAEDLLGQPWDCLEMQRLAPTLSEPVVTHD